MQFINTHKRVQKAVPFQTLALWSNIFMNFETDNMFKTSLKKKSTVESSLLKFYWCLCFILIVLHVPR